MFRPKTWALASAIAGALALPTAAFATTAGYFQLGYSAKSDGMAGASAALPQDSMSQATNPAGIAFVGSRLDVGVAGFWAFRGYEAGPGHYPNPGAYGSNSNAFLIPHAGYSVRLDRDNYAGVAIYGNGGMSTNFNNGTAGPYYGGQTGVNLQQLFVQATYARKFWRHDAVGVSLLYAHQRFSADGLSGFAAQSSHPHHLSNNGVSGSNGVGFKVGGQFRIVPGLDLGLAYSPRMTMSKFSGYTGLFAGGGRLDIPANGVVGVAFKPMAGQVVAFDFQRIFYNDVPAIANPFPNGNALGSANGPGFGWQNIDVYKLGYQFAVDRTVTARVGFAYNNQPILPSQVLLNVIAPGVIQRHVTAGFTAHTGPGQDVTVAALYGLPQSVAGRAPSAYGGGTVRLHMHEYQIEAQWGWRF